MSESLITTWSTAAASRRLADRCHLGPVATCLRPPATALPYRRCARWACAWQAFRRCFSATRRSDTTRGRVLPADWFADLLLGTHERGLPQRAKMLVSGCFGSTANGAAFADWLDDILPGCPQLRAWTR